MEAIPIEQSNYPAVLLSLSFLSYVLIRFRFTRRMPELLSAFASKRFISQLLREENPFLNVSSIVLYLNYVLNAALFFSLLLQQNVLEHPLFQGLTGFFFALLLLFLFDLSKLLSYWGSAFIFQSETQTSNYVLYLMSSRQVGGIIFFVLNLFLAYSPIPSIYIAWFALFNVSLLSLHRLIRSVPISQNFASFSIHHFLLYICTLELSPVLLGGKLFLINWFSVYY